MNDNTEIRLDSGKTATAQCPVIISASRSTDIPAFYSEWFFNRLKKGYSAWTNPYNSSKIHISYERTKFIVFWSKNPKPLLGHIDTLDELGIGCYIQYTLNDYGEEGLEKGVPPLSQRIDMYAEAMAKYGLERGIRGSEARHIGQHEYYRDCMVKKKGLEEDIGNLSTEKRKLDKEKKSLESKVENLECRTTALDSRKKMLTQVNEEIRQQNNELYSENSRLTEANSSLAAENKSLAATSSKLSDDVVRLQMRKLNSEADGDFKKYKADIARYFPDLEDLLNWGRYCTHIGFPDSLTQRILAQEKVGFAGAIFSSEHNQTFRTERSVAILERDPENQHRFILNIDGVSVFQWFRDMARKLLEKLGFRPKKPTQSHGIRR